MTGGGIHLTLIIPTVGRSQALAELLDDVRNQEVRPEEVIIPDAMYSNECQNLCAAWNKEHPQYPVTHLPCPDSARGLPASRNIAVANSKGEYIAFLDDDTRLHPGYFKSMLEPLISSDIVGGVGGYIINESKWSHSETYCESPVINNGWLYTEGYRCRLPLRWRWRVRLGLAGSVQPGKWSDSGHVWPVGFLPPGDTCVDVDFVMGGASCWRRSVFYEARFPSELKGYGHYEDMIFALQVSRKYRVVLQRSAILEHHHNPSGRPNHRQYGYQVAYNGYSLWRQFRRSRELRNTMLYWAVEIFNMLARLYTPGGINEVAGRIAGAVDALRKPALFIQKSAFDMYL